MNVRVLATHDGTFHADEVTAYAVLSRLFPSAALLRTRDESLLSALPEGSVIFDVGMRYDPDALMFDHHMKDAPLRDDGTPYSSVGLVWDRFGRDYVRLVGPEADTRTVEEAWETVDSGFVRALDMADNGIGTVSAVDLPALVDDVNPSWDDPSPEPDAAFRLAVAMVSRTLVMRVATALSAARAKAVVTAALGGRDTPEILVLDRSMPWQSAVFDGESGAGALLYVVSPNASGGAWHVSAVPPRKGSFDQRRPLPSEWAGLRGEGLAALTGVADAVFCHPGLFVCGAGSREGAVTLARMAAGLDPFPSAAPAA